MLGPVVASDVPDGWADAWRRFHRPLRVGPLWIGPPWEPSPPGELAVVIDPGQAFGTGAHATTRSCLELLLELADRGEARGPLADWGTGSAVLAIAAAKLGWAPVVAVDHERAAVAAARENAERNGAAITVERLNLRDQPPPEAPTVVANLLTPLLVDLAARIADAAIAAPTTLVLSGLLAGEADRVADAFAAAGFSRESTVVAGEWAALLLRR